MVARVSTIKTRGITVFTTGEVARICKVAPRTVSKWFDSGRLKGYRIPGGQDRRIPRANLIQFLKDHNFPMDELEAESKTQVLLIAPERLLPTYLRERLPEADYPIRTAADAFAAGIEIATFSPDAVVVDLRVGRAEAVAIAERLHRAAEGGPRPLLVALMGDTDDYDAMKLAGYDEVFQKPFNPDLLAARISQLREQV